MKRILYLLLIMASFVMLFVLAKPAFMLYNGAIGQGAEMSDFVDVILHGLTLDWCVTACIIFPLLLISVFPKPSRKLCLAYTGIVIVLTVLALVADTCLYEFWDIKLDSTVLAYLDSPRGVTSSVSTLFIIATSLVIVIVSVIVYLWMRWVIDRLLSSDGIDNMSATQRGNAFGLYLITVAFLILCIRGIHRLLPDASDDTISVASAYYSPRQLFNHSAVNPVFSFVTSVGNKARGISPDTFMTDEEAERLFASLAYNTKSHIAPEDSLLTAEFLHQFRNDSAQIVLIIMEGCGGTLISEVCGTTPELTPHLNRLCQEGVFFENCYANSFRTDRGVLCALSGYPAFPDISVMRQKGKVAALPGLAKSLNRTNDFLYGGDKDFTSMADYLRTTGYNHVWGDTDFPESQRRTHDWGVTDRITFQTLENLTIGQRPLNHKSSTINHKPSTFITFLTLASHEPWEVPYKHMAKKGKIANSFAYLDDCLGNYINHLKASPRWDNTLVILIADHGIAWPGNISEANIDRYHIPMIWTGGAIRSPRRISQICNQTDLPATLLGQLGISHDEYPFSRDVLSQTYTQPCAQHAWAEGFSFIDDTGYTVIDLHTLQPLTDVNTSRDGTNTEKVERKLLRAKKAKAFLQTAYKDLENK